MAFAYCYDLTTIKFGTGITTIEDYAFCSCESSQFDSATGQAFDDLYDAGIITNSVWNCYFPDSGGGVD